jgi:hypothetical protein
MPQRYKSLLDFHRLNSRLLSDARNRLADFVIEGTLCGVPEIR